MHDSQDYPLANAYRHLDFIQMVVKLYTVPKAMNDFIVNNEM
jgi:hypothetical protein